MILATSTLLLVVTAVNSRPSVTDYRPRPYGEPLKPYAFSHKAVLDDNVFGTGQISRQETADGTRRVQGPYSLANAEGHTRLVEYVADQDGFRAHGGTNEPGTGKQNPADAVMGSSSSFANRNYQYSQEVGARRPVDTAEPAASKRVSWRIPTIRKPVRIPP